MTANLERLLTQIRRLTNDELAELKRHLCDHDRARRPTPPRRPLEPADAVDRTVRGRTL